MSLKGILYAYILGGLTFIPLLLASLVLFTIYTSVPVGDLDVSQKRKSVMEGRLQDEEEAPEMTATAIGDINDLPKTRKGWLTMRRTFEQSAFDGGYVTLVRSFLDARSKDPKRSRPKDMWYVVLKGKILYLYEDEGMTECEAVIQLGAHDVTIYPEGLLDGELFAKRNAICLQPKDSEADSIMPSVTKAMKLDGNDVGKKSKDTETSTKAAETMTDPEKLKTVTAKEEAVDSNTPWFIFVRSNVEMEDWYLSLVHASDHPAQTHHLSPLQAIFLPSDMNLLVTTLDEQPDVIPMRWLNALIGRIFYSFYKTHLLEAFIIGRLMKKLSKIKRPTFLADIVVTQVSVGNTAPTFSKPMLKELTKEGDASLEIHLLYKGEVRLTVEATANINLGTFKSYNVKLVLAVVLKEIEGNLLVKVKRPPSNRIWYAFTQMPRMVLEVEPIVSDRQITWSMILSTIESRLKEIIQESVVLPNMDDIAFFESLSHQHRGGIWPDAQRVPDQSSKDTGTEIDVVEASTETEPPPLIQKTTSLQERTTSSPEPSHITTSSTEPGFTDESSQLNRRRTWFSTVRNDEKLPSNEYENPTSKDGDETRGRSVDVGNITSTRSHSPPGEPDHTEDGSDDGTSSQKTSQSHLSVNDGPSRRSSSRTSSISDDQGNRPPVSFQSSQASRSQGDQPPPSPELTRTSPASPSTSSFLSTLKSKAGDKQALSNSAKEAMRKWSINWGGLRKESMGTTGSSDEMPDHGPVDSQERVASTSSFSHKARTSYAEVRAAVAERLRGGEDSRSTQLSSIPDALSRTRTVSSSMLPLAQSSLRRNHESDISDSILPIDDAPENPIHVQPQAKTMSIPGIHASHKGNVMSMGYVVPPVSPPPETKKNPVLRLWKSPVLSGSTDNTVVIAHPEGNQSVESLEPPLNNVSIPRPPPPALPPRPSVTRPPVQHTRVASDPSAQSASDSLKSIVDKEEKRTGRPSISDQTPPISPPNPDPNATETLPLPRIEVASS
ncbi:uncharacterized protein BT62DRAFT_941230 [Guyanagaster necrorhizus]|uniref:SMP-LTD domain-containing protein n=1 Tax=Guyanagaster necrorhizus TaxID=856835 RepID=A0A9P7W4S9_9AGAR|nr:uncharacterized protein BT62DRAFT_941230 [Guyanagaster necrorhizus MCA 3950]KAG7452142.1 hypothetical protein BT62DRAFT_941230 [Guyanagaster necrorhizus MCA 3950]